ncbi:hypothetical protein HPB52_009153 [Rhipicephalus sanguineus]|uniref:Uncharacterized protein n=1 Tax=Rhipicephalus sanguineus TaxID=34632 RepID=A0A9D4PHU9_RHISA|nr:hypothetical protein HPB52_009153 [Rhipicephalus sanguineus]
MTAPLTLRCGPVEDATTSSDVDSIPELLSALCSSSCLHINIDVTRIWLRSLSALGGGVPLAAQVTPIAALCMVSLWCGKSFTGMLLE